ncbi:hypothetical protein G4G28_02045 [Massilia sp. Dwa41.01b]|uniref:hypothetical protein n=1 Tax=unclassified Massilia TaxID=2609279 RepID=UPI00160300CB|nr:MULTISPECIES: hypothetical protein [unclassified Massilia]QNA87548.1 hypothetical protein G4G28_02045 [Massilia sp. Dwa41.01b]QNA98458.1 hypothetical protein G4G31_05800 [Massilia sp. Se16.2.3]
MSDRSARDKLIGAVSAWHKRHADLLPENARVRQEIQAEAYAPTAPPGLKAEFDEMFDKRMPQQVESDYKKLLPPGSSNGWASKAFVCGANAGIIEHGQYDLERFDPQVAAYLRKRIAAMRSGTATNP